MFALNSYLHHQYQLPALAMIDETMRNPTRAVHHHASHNDNAKVAADVHDRTNTMTLELIKKAEATLRTYSRSSQPNVERRRIMRVDAS